MNNTFSTPDPYLNPSAYAAQARERDARRRAGLGYIVARTDAEREYRERVIARANAESTSILHAVWLTDMDNLDNLPHCTVCDGRITEHMPNPHNLCKARKARDLPTPRMDWMPVCACYTCNN